MTSPPRGDSPHAPRTRCYALVPCAGVGARAGAEGPKQYAPLGGRPLVAWTLAALAGVGELEGTLLVLAPDDTRFDALLAAYKKQPNAFPSPSLFARDNTGSIARSDPIPSQAPRLFRP